MAEVVVLTTSRLQRRILDRLRLLWLDQTLSLQREPICLLEDQADLLLRSTPKTTGAMAGVGGGRVHMITRGKESGDRRGTGATVQIAETSHRVHPCHRGKMSGHHGERI